MERVNFLRWWCESMLGHCRKDLDHLLCEIRCAEIVELIRSCSSKRLTNDHHSSVMGIDHFFVLFSCQETKSKGVVQDRLPITCVGTVDYFDVCVQEVHTEFSSRAKVEQIKLSFLFFVEVVCWIGISLHDLPLKELSEAEFEHKCTYSISHFLRFLHQSIDFDSVNELCAEDFFIGHMVYHSRCVVLLRRDYAGIMIASLIRSLTLVVTFIVKLYSRHSDQFVDIETPREHSKNVYQHLKVVQI